MGPIRPISALKTKALSSDGLLVHSSALSETELVLLNREKTEKNRSTNFLLTNKGLVSRETVVLHRWRSETQNFVFIIR